MRDHEYPRLFLTVMETERISEGAESQDDVRPTLAGRRAVVELAHAVANRRLLGISREHAALGQAIQQAELLLAQSFVDDARRIGTDADARDVVGGLNRAGVRRSE